MSPQTAGPNAANGMTPQSKPGVREGTIRFMLDPERARNEKVAVAEFFSVEEEEYEEEVERRRR
jgi:CTD kinase subunit beta